MQYITPSGSAFDLYQKMLAAPHLLIAGSTGSGKSVLINSLVATALYGSPARSEFVLLDPKTTELWQWSKLPHTIGYAYETDEMLKLLRSTVEIMENRLRHMHQMGERVWSGAQIYVVIDELADLLTTCKADASPLIQRIGQIGRAAGIHLIAATQCLLASVISTPIRVNLSSIVCLRTATKRQSVFVCDRPGAELFPDPAATGRALAYYRTGADIKSFEVYRVPDDEQQRLIAWWMDPAHTI